MEYLKPGFLISLLVGGALVAACSMGQQMYNKTPEESLRMRAVFRDFVIGAFLSATLYTFLPESVDTFISSGSELFTKNPSGGSVSTATSSDIELQTGPARF
jgi:hypothetical protein